MAKVICGNFIGADFSENSNFPDITPMRFAFFARMFDDDGNPVNGMDSVETLPVDIKSTPAHINESIVEAAITQAESLGFTIKSADVIFQPFDRG